MPLEHVAPLSYPSSSLEELVAALTKNRRELETFINSSVVRKEANGIINLPTGSTLNAVDLVDDTHDHAGGDGNQIDHGGLAGLSDVADHVGYARGQVAYAEITSGVTGLTGTADVTGLTVTFTPVSGRRYKVTAYLRLTSPSAAGSLLVSIVDGAGAGTSIGSESLASSEARVAQRVEYFDGGGSEITRKVQVVTFGGRTIDVAAGTDGRSFIAVEDIGAP